ncbi:peptide methionine sulfoxide reductase MsrA [Xylaria bambusicola]|uniref:peptide methionine sulfoxide reductase MsrA n=1 Tax=Xylaria bambusicola TaxID=326684 RepID=UPI002007C65D|nr:peptide methionine sulfoxide reductase MsrA [Xylaria bambusicola]KAI0509064.1 peptide methionine sulfoxide reductase MsrA [Xylaria bambusicola]
MPTSSSASKSTSNSKSNNGISFNSAFVALVFAFLLMAFTMPSFIQRLFRPMSTSMGVTASGGGSPRAAVPEGAEKATLGAGCFWGVEHLYRKHFGGDKGIYDTRVGYTGGDTTNPSYKQVCGGKTGHNEALLIYYDPAKVTYRQLLEFFYRMHDPTTANRQGPDMGTNYRSGIYFHNEEQEQVAKEVTKQANEQWYKGKIVTEIVPAGPWWDAEDYHQLYLNKNPWGYECPSHFLRPFEPLEQK